MSAVALRQETWGLHLEESAREVFTTMLNTALEPCDNDERAFRSEVTAVVGLAGALSGNFVLCCNREGLEKMAECMLGAPAEEGEAIDALGEVCNMLAGSWKRRIHELADACMLSVPTVVLGSRYQVHSPRSRDLLKQQFRFCGGPLSLQLQVES